MIRPATPEDVPVVHSLVRELARYERLEHQVTASVNDLHDHLFGPHRFVEVLLAEDGGARAGFAAYFHNYSTFLGRPGMYVEDIFVLPEYRRRGHGRALLREMARIAVARGCSRFEWAVLDWNDPAIAFYRSIGAPPLPDWRICRLTGEGLARFAQSDPPPGDDCDRSSGPRSEPR